MAKPPIQNSLLGAYVTPDLLKLVNQLVQSQIGPERQRLERERALAAERAKSRGEALQGFSGATAEILKGIAPATEQTYANAADRQSIFAKGFSDGLKLQQTQGAGEANALLAQQGSPQTIAGDTGASDVLYGLGGYIPASTLNREGAAFTAAAQQLPVSELARGKQDFTRSLVEGEEQQKQYGQQLIDLAAKAPGLKAQALTQVIGLALQAQAVETARAYLANTQRKTEAGITGYDPLTGLPVTNPKAAVAKEKRVSKREDAVVDAVDYVTQKVIEPAITPGTEIKQTGSQPVTAPSLNIPAHVGTKGEKIPARSIPRWYRQDHTLTTDPNDPNILVKPIYERVPLPKAQFSSLLQKVMTQLRLRLQRYGIKPSRIKSIAMDLLDDYFVITEVTVSPSASEPGFQNVR